MYLTIYEQLALTAAITPYHNFIKYLPINFFCVWIHINFIKGEKSALKIGDLAEFNPVEFLQVWSPNFSVFF